MRYNVETWLLEWIYKILTIKTLYSRKAADQGHPHASYNLAVGHMKNIRTDLVKKGFV